MSAANAVTVISHTRPDDVAPSLQRLTEAARASGVTLRFDPDETVKHGVRPSRA